MTQDEFAELDEEDRLETIFRPRKKQFEFSEEQLDNITEEMTHVRIPSEGEIPLGEEDR